MTTYRIELETDRNVRLIKDDNAKASRPFDGGHIYYQPESYPAKICSFHFGSPIYREDEENKAYATPASYPSEMLDYQEVEVSDEAEWWAVARAYADGQPIAA